MTSFSNIIIAVFCIVPFIEATKVFFGFPYSTIPIDFLVFFFFFWVISGKRHYRFHSLHYLFFFILLFSFVYIFNPYYNNLVFKIKGFRSSAFYMIAFFFPLVQEIDERFIAKFLKANLITSILVSLYAIRQFFFPFAVERAYATLPGTGTTFEGDLYNRVAGVFRVFGSFAASTHLAAYCIWAIFIALAGLLFHAFSRRLCISAVVLNLFAVALTFSRTSFLALGAAAAAMAWLYGRTRGVVTATLSLLAMTFLILPIGAIAIYYVPMFRDRLLTIGSLDQVSAFATRLSIWQERLGQIASKPAGYGTGLAGFQDVTNYQLIADNYYIKVLIEWGWFGGGLFILGLLWLLFRLNTSTNPRKECFELCLSSSTATFLVAILVMMITGQILEAYPIGFIFWYVLGLAYATTFTVPHQHPYGSHQPSSDEYNLWPNRLPSSGT